jgi:hypothetical protein
MNRILKTHKSFTLTFVLALLFSMVFVSGMLITKDTWLLSFVKHQYTSKSAFCSINSHGGEKALGE